MPRRYDWFFKEVFLILSAPIFWAVLTNFGRVWRFIDDRYYHKEAKQYRKAEKGPWTTESTGKSRRKGTKRRNVRYEAYHAAPKGVVFHLGDLPGDP